MKKYASYKEFAKDFPIQQAVNTGLFGYERVYDCINLTRCIYKTRSEAGKARKQNFEDYKKQERAKEGKTTTELIQDYENFRD